MKVETLQRWIDKLPPDAEVTFFGNFRRLEVEEAYESEPIRDCRQYVIELSEPK